MKRPLVTLACICALALPAIGLAGKSGDGSEYGTQPGFDIANENTPWAGHGAFGYFGKDNNLATGANGYQTGINNATLCGNRQGNLPSALSHRCRLRTSRQLRTTKTPRAAGVFHECAR